MTIDVLYEDNHLLVVYKPRGILSQADASEKEDMLTLLKAYLKQKYQKPGNVYVGLVHRLDCNTSGVMVFAKTSKAASRLSKDILHHRFEKKYHALLEGWLMHSGCLKTHLKKDERLKMSLVDPSGKEAVLDYRIEKKGYYNDRKVTWVDVDLKTGRFHQIRSQFASIGHPLAGDRKYGSTYPFPYCLEAYHLGFYHPVTKVWLIFEKSPMQEELLPHIV